MDGTLVDTSELIYQCFLHTVKHYHCPAIERRQVVAHIGLPLKQQLELFLGKMTDSEFTDVYGIYNKYQLEIIPAYLTVFPHVHTTLRELKKRGKKLVIVTSRKLKSLENFLTLKGLAEYFDLLITPESTLRHKPHPEPVLKALTLLKAEPKAVLFTGDSIWDVESGKAAGVDTALVAWGNNDISDLSPQPTYRLRSIHDLIVDPS